MPETEKVIKRCRLVNALVSEGLKTYADRDKADVLALVNGILKGRKPEGCEAAESLLLRRLPQYRTTDEIIRDLKDNG